MMESLRPAQTVPSPPPPDLGLHFSIFEIFSFGRASLAPWSWGGGNGL